MIETIWGLTEEDDPIVTTLITSENTSIMAMFSVSWIVVKSLVTSYLL